MEYTSLQGMQDPHMEEDQEIQTVSKGPFELNVVLRTNPLAGSFPCILDENTENNLATLTGALLHHFANLSKMTTDTSATPGHLRVHRPRHIADMSFNENTHHPLLEERKIHVIICEYRKLDYRTLVVDWETPAMDLDKKITAREFVALYGSNTPTWDRLELEDCKNLGAGASFELLEYERVLKLVCERFEEEVMPYQDAVSEDDPNPLAEEKMSLIVRFLFTNAVMLYGGRLTLQMDQTLGGNLGKGRVECKIKLAPHTSTTSAPTIMIVTLIRDSMVNDAIARNLVLLDQLCRQTYAAEEVSTANGIVTNGYKWYFTECVQDVPQNGEMVLPCPLSWAAKLTSEIGFAGDHEWVRPEDIFGRIVMQLEAILGHQ
ncbi:hypothetical protein BGX23_003015 [Mortierella sp. AD031]|nr:hypothetical protein BGX23_003015 [Mortierella sp. AD031]